MKEIIGIVATTSNNVIGYKNSLIFNIPNEMHHFKKRTTTVRDSTKRNAIIMGRTTYDICGKLLGRFNCVISKTLVLSDSEHLIVRNSVESLLIELNRMDDIETIFVIGGGSIYSYIRDHNYCTKFIITIINLPVAYGDCFFKSLDPSQYTCTSIRSYKNNKAYERKTQVSTEQSYSIVEYRNKNPTTTYTLSSGGEAGYLAALKRVLLEGVRRQTRNSKTLSLFGVKLDFDISERFPLMTTKKMYWSGILHELLWFISGNTNSKLLEEKHVRIWKGNSTREYLDSIGLEHYPEGDCGPIYGFQWRHFNAPYTGTNSNYHGQGVDQLKNVINLLRNDPTSRRIFMTSWNPGQLSEMALPPCHVSYQFYVRTIRSKNYLDCIMYQRSGDMFLGVPFNIASTATLVHILGSITNLLPGKISILIGDAHIYEDHIEQVKEQIQRRPHIFPTLTLNVPITDIDDLKYGHFEIANYIHYPRIAAKMTP